MKKLVIPLIIVIVAVGGIWYTRKTPKIQPTGTTTDSTYRNSNLGISFTYPKIVEAGTTGETIILHHEVPFVHHDYCDFKGEGTTTINSLTDFNVKFHLVNKGLVDAMRAESSYIPEENFVNGKIVPSPGFIDEYKTDSLNGFSIFEGAEGCGQTIYYLSVNDSKTLVVVKDLITVFTGAIDAENKDKAEAVPGVINADRATIIFNSIMKTVKVN